MNIKNHLIDRGIDFTKINPYISDEGDVCTFFLYNLSGSIVGYQHYNPKGTKSFNQSKADKSVMKYFTWVSGKKQTRDKKIGVWGMETYLWDFPFLFVTEGVFDAAPFHLFGLPAISLLTNDPDKSTKLWLKTLPQKLVVIADDDESENKEKKNNAGDKLAKLGDYVFYPPKPYKDAGEFWEEDKDGFEKWLISIRNNIT